MIVHTYCHSSKAVKIESFHRSHKGPVSAGATAEKTAGTSGATDETDGTGWISNREDRHTDEDVCICMHVCMDVCKLCKHTVVITITIAVITFVTTIIVITIPKPSWLHL